YRLGQSLSQTGLGGGGNVRDDISNLHFDVYSYPGGGSGRFQNTDKGRKSLLKWLKSRQSVMVVFEPTRPYHKALEAGTEHLMPMRQIRMEPEPRNVATVSSSFKARRFDID
ncbi:hypothetical protein, partial [Paracoccus rhizosphaerae]